MSVHIANILEEGLPITEMSWEMKKAIIHAISYIREVEEIQRRFVFDGYDLASEVKLKEER